VHTEFWKKKSMETDGYSKKARKPRNKIIVSKNEVLKNYVVWRISTSVENLKQIFKSKDEEE